LDITQVSVLLGAVSSVAVVAGAGFIVFQLRQNAKLLRETAHANKATIAFSMFERIIADSFVRRRKNVYDMVDRYQAKNWEGLLNTMEDLEARNYAYMYELFGQFVKDGVIDKLMVMNALKSIVVMDWMKMEPMIRYLNKTLNLKINPWENFEWLAKETEAYLKDLESRTPAS